MPSKEHHSYGKTWWQEFKEKLILPTFPKWGRINKKITNAQYCHIIIRQEKKNWNHQPHYSDPIHQSSSTVDKEQEENALKLSIQNPEMGHDLEQFYKF